MQFPVGLAFIKVPNWREVFQNIQQTNCSSHAQPAMPPFLASALVLLGVAHKRHQHPAVVSEVKPPPLCWDEAGEPAHSAA
jgi:hypothetical protein